MMIERSRQKVVAEALQQQPAVALLGPRQVGKTTLAKVVSASTPSVYLDLESARDYEKLADPYAFFAAHKNKLVVLDEIQRFPEIFAILRGVIDEARLAGHRSGQFLLLGSASLQLLQQISESLAGRIRHVELHPLSALEVEAQPVAQNNLWVRGGFPESFLASSAAQSLLWRQDFVRSFLERDVPLFGSRIPAETLRRLWTMLAHAQGTCLDATKLGASLDISRTTVSRYIDLLVDLLVVRRLAPWYHNTKKRLVKTPKVYVRDCGIAHALLQIETLDDLLGHPVAGSSWEGLAIENIIAALPPMASYGFYRTSAGAEIDLVVEFSIGDLWAIEIKRSSTPKVSRGFYEGCHDLAPAKTFLVYPGKEQYPARENLQVIGLRAMVETIERRR